MEKWTGKLYDSRRDINADPVTLVCTKSDRTSKTDSYKINKLFSKHLFIGHVVIIMKLQFVFFCMKLVNIKQLYVKC